MLQTPKFLQSSIKLFPHPTKAQSPHKPQDQELPKSHFCPTLKQCRKISRRDLALGTNSLLTLLLGIHTLGPFTLSKAKADENSNEKEVLEDGSDSSRIEKLENGCDKSLTNKAFLDISIDGEPIGRVVIGLYGNDAPLGAARFSNLVSGRAGISYRRKEFVKILPNYVQHGGVRSYGIDAELARRSGGNLEAESLMDELERSEEQCPGIRNSAGSVSIVVRDLSRPPPKMKLVAKQGKLEIGQEEVGGPGPNGTEFVISLKDSPELDASALVVGRVLEGTEVVERIGQVKSVNENTSSPYFRVAKLIGDKRAVIAERGFNRPYSKIVVTNCGLIE